MFTTSIDIQIRTLDSTGAPVSVSSIEGIVRNSEGNRVATLTLEDLPETSRGVYGVQGYDVSDSQKFPGTELTVFWCVPEAGASPEEAFQRYSIFSPVNVSGTTRMLTWCPTQAPNVYGYELFRKLDGGERVSYAKTVYPYFFDRGIYLDQKEWELAKFQAEPMIWTTEVDTPEGNGVVSEVNRVVNDKQYCEIFGEVLDVVGAGVVESIYFYVHETDAPQNSGRSFLMRRNEISVTPNARGQFSAPLICGSLVTAEIPGAGVTRRFIVPNTPRVNFKDLEFYPLDTHRAQ